MFKSYKNAFYSKYLDIYTSIVYGGDGGGDGGGGGMRGGDGGGCGGVGMEGVVVGQWGHRREQ